MKILHVVDYLMPTMGYQDFLLPKWNKKQNNQTFILASNKFYPVPNYDQTWKKFLGKREQKKGWSTLNGVKILKKKIYFEISSRPWIANLESEILKINPDIILVHSTTSFSALRVALFCKKQNKPCMFDNHMVFNAVSNSFMSKLFYFFVRNFLSKIISKVAYKIIGVTNETCKYLEKKEGYKKKLIYHLPLGVDNSIFYPFKKNNSKKQKNKFRVIQTGKLNNDKKPQWTAKAVLELLKKGENIDLEFIGGGSNKIRLEIEEQYKKNNFFNKIKFKKFLNQKQLSQAYNDCDLCIFPEGTSLSALEVAACKKPVIMTDYLASRNRSKLGIGLTYKTGNINDLKKTILKLIKNKKFYNKVCDNSYKAINKHYTYEYISKIFITLCKKAILAQNN